MCCQEGSYGLLLMLADTCPQDASIRDVVSQLLNLMPTFPEVNQKLTRALLEQQPADFLSSLWTSVSTGHTPVILAAHLKYTIQVNVLVPPVFRCILGLIVVSLPDEPYSTKWAGLSSFVGCKATIMLPLCP